MFARASGIFCCFCFSTAGAGAVAVAAACFCCGRLCCYCCCYCCCCCCCCYCTTYCWLVLLGVFFPFLPTLLRKLHGDGCCCTERSEKFRVLPRYDYEKKHVSRDSKMCCCCCRFCCGAPTTDERIHAPVLHDASQIDYCRY